MFFINDMLSNNGEFLTELEFKNMYNINTNFIEFNGIIQAITKFAKNTKNTVINKRLHNPLLPTYLKIYHKSNKGCKDFYYLFNHNKAKPTAISRWEQVYNISEETWKDIFVSPFKNKYYSTTLQWFQTRINHRILPTRKYLYTIKAIPSPVCAYCDLEETLTHLFWSCPMTNLFLQKNTVMAKKKRYYNTVY